MKSKLSYLKFLLWIILLFGWMPITAQVLNKPVAAPNQTPPPGTTAWTKACASPSFNDYWVNFTWSPPLVNADNEFILELSDASGDFSSAVELARDGSQNVTFDFYFQFQVPVGTMGEAYRFRVRSTSPAKTSPVSNPYPIYYTDINTGLTIRQQGKADFGDGKAQVCDGNSITLEVYGIANPGNYQYNWYRSGSPLAEKGESITVSQAGMYNVEVDYGACSGSGNTLSNLIDVTTGSSLGIAINPPAKTGLCSGESVDLVSNISGMGLTYIWYKDGIAVSSPTVDNDTYTVDASIAGFEGDYSVEIFGTGACVERSAAISITNAGDFTVNRDNDATLVILPGGSVELSGSTTAGSPLYQWFKDGIAIAGATTVTHTVNDISQTGQYHLEVTQNGGACASTTKASEPTEIVAPDSFELVIEYTTAYTPCANTDMVLGLAAINAIHSGGQKTDVSSQLSSSFAYQWKKDGLDVAGATSSSISLTTPSENGLYSLAASLGGYTPESDQLSLELRVNEDLNITATDLIVCDSSTDIYISTPTDLSGQTFQWLLNGQDLGAVTDSLQITDPGTYQLVLERNGCPVPSNEVNISSLDPSIITFDREGTIVFPEGSSKTVTASGGDSYKWYDSNNLEVGTTASLTLTTEGNYQLIATIGNCTVSRSIKAEYLETYKVPNVISVNGDGINDQWMVPNSYANNSDITVTIYNDRGEAVFKTTSYQNNWPESTTVFPRQNMIFYYKIQRDSEVLKQGTITVIR